MGVARLPLATSPRRRSGCGCAPMVLSPSRWILRRATRGAEEGVPRPLRGVRGMAEDVKRLKARRHGVCSPRRVNPQTTPWTPTEVAYRLPIPEAAGATQHAGARARQPRRAPKSHPLGAHACPRGAAKPTSPSLNPKEKSNSPNSLQEASSGRAAARRAAACPPCCRRAAQPRPGSSPRSGTLASRAAWHWSKRLLRSDSDFLPFAL